MASAQHRRLAALEAEAERQSQALGAAAADAIFSDWTDEELETFLAACERAEASEWGGETITLANLDLFCQSVGFTVREEGVIRKLHTELWAWKAQAELREGDGCLEVHHSGAIVAWLSSRALWEAL